MKVLTAVNPEGWPGVGERAVEGEIVWLPPKCGRAGCSCLRAFAGCVTHGLVPTARVEELDTTPEELFELLAETVCKDCYQPWQIPALAQRMTALAERHRVGAVLARGPRAASAGYDPARARTTTGRP